MKKILSALLVALLMLSTLTLVSCDKEPETLKFGLGVYVNVTKADSATEDAEGQGNVAVTAAAVTVDAEGKIVSCVLDTADNTVKYTAEGKAVANDSFKTKYELGDDYGMVKYGAAKEWYQQADAFVAVVAGKTLDEVKALVAAGDKGNDEVINAGCTITISDFVKAIEKAYKNAVDSAATADTKIKLGMHTEQTCTDATEDKGGSSKLETTVFAAAVDADGKVVVASSDCAQITFTFDTAGASTYDTSKAVSTKKELGDDYGMVKYGAKAEWYAQAAAFDAACVGKTASEIASLMGSDNYGNADLKAAGCTILVNGFVKAASKIG